MATREQQIKWKRDYRVRKAGFTSYEEYKIDYTARRSQSIRIAKARKKIQQQAKLNITSIWKNNGITEPWKSADITKQDYYNWLGGLLCRN